jgi:hypothetical protein
MTLKPWFVTALVVVLLGLGAVIGSRYVPTFNSNIQLEFKENSCVIRCPAQGAFPSMQGGVTCTAGTAPLCQCTDAQKPIAGCVPVN